MNTYNRILRRVAALTAVLALMATPALAQKQFIAAGQGRLLNRDMEARRLPEKLDWAKTTIAKPQIEKPANFKAVRKTPVKSIDELVGPAIIRSRSGFTGVNYGGNSINISKVNSTTLAIEHFTSTATEKIKVQVNLSKQTFTIPAGQLLSTVQGYKIYLRVITDDNKVDTSSALQGYINDDGEMVITSHWSDMYEGNDDYFHPYEGLWSYSFCIPANATMSVTNNDEKKTKSTYNVCLYYSTKHDTIYAYNFGDYGQGVRINVDKNKKVTIPSQLVFDVEDQDNYWDNGDPLRDFYSYATDWSQNKATTPEIYGTITTKQISFGNWAIIDWQNSGIYSAGQFIDGKITLNDGLAFELPSAEEYLNVDPTELNIPSTGGSYVVYVDASTAWSVTNVPSWLTCKTGSGQFTVTANANNSTEERTATIIVKAGNLSREVSVRQGGKANEDITYKPSGGAVRYTLHTATKTATVDNVEGKYADLEVPSTISYEGNTYTVDEVGDRILANSDNSFNFSVTFPSTIKSVSPTAFANAEVCAIVWNSKTPMPSNSLDNSDDNWKNRLLFVTSDGIAPSGFANTVVDGKIRNLTLYEGYIFHSPQDFVAQTVTFTHDFTMETVIGGKQGWETIALPFDVQTISHASKGNMVPFASYNPSSAYKPFWLYEWTNGGFARAATMEANKPYLISMPNSTEYPADYNLAGRVTFTGKNALVKATTDGNIKPVKYNGKLFYANYFYLQTENQSTIYNINSDSYMHKDASGYAPGSVFLNNQRNTFPFEGFIEHTSSSAREVLEIEFAPENSEVQGIDDLMVAAPANGTYTLSGQRVSSTKAGIYIVDGKKKVVK